MKYLKRPRITSDIKPMVKQIKRDFGLWAEPFSLHSAVPRLLAGCWACVRESVLVGELPRHLKEALAVAVSQANACSYCVDAHTIMLHAAHQHDIASVILAGRLDAIDDPDTRQVVAFGLQSTEPTPPSLPARLDLPEVYGTIFAFHYINRMVHVFLPDTPLFIKQAQSVQRRMAGWFFARSARNTLSPGASLEFLPGAEVPSDMPWAGDGNVAQAFGRCAAVIEEVGAKALSAQTRAVVADYIRDWDGAEPPLGPAWLQQTTESLTEHDAIETRIALLTAVAAHRVDAASVEHYRQLGHDDADVVGATAWAAFTTARQIVARLASH